MIPVISLLTSLGSKIVDTVSKHIKDKEERAKLQLEIQKQFFEASMQLQQELLKQQGSIIVSEATGHSWLQRNWRPITMLVFVFIIANNYILVPYGQAFGLHIPLLNLPDQVWELIKYGLTGYIGARSTEKIASMITQYKTAKHIAEKISDPTKLFSEPKRIPKLTDITGNKNDVTDFNLTLDKDSNF